MITAQELLDNEQQAIKFLATESPLRRKILNQMLEINMKLSLELLSKSWDQPKGAKFETKVQSETQASQDQDQKQPD